MAFDQSTRNRLQKFVSNARAILGEEFTRQLQATYGLDPKQGTVAAIDSLTHLDNRQRQTAHLLRETLAHYLATTPGKGEKDRTKQVLDRIVREQAFTVLNRLAALRMAEARGFLLESIAKAHSSKGFQLYRQLSGTAHGETGDAYRNYLFSLFDEFSLDLAVLFDRHSAQGRLFPRESALLELLAEINHHEIEHLWAEDETIGWIYQYFNSQEERKKMRAESQAPRNSRELAVRNQFFTPRYVVEFLTDNTLGRIWYEMTQGNTALVDSCRYLVRRPTEIFLKPGETAPVSEASDGEALSQEELLKQPVYIPHRPLKDPRSIRMLDPACGSMHFGLYAFDLFERIYLEAWQLEQQLGPDAFTRAAGQQALQSTFDSLEAFKQQIPKLIIEHNIHGVDIDPRAVQIAGLSLWQRAQRAWHQQGIKPQQRPTIVKSNIVCAEPMPGEKALLQEFTCKLNPPVLGQLLEVIFDKMQLAGEAGTLLKIEEEIQAAIHEAREQWLKQSGSNSVGDMFQAELDAATPQAKLGFDLRGIDDVTFWDDAEQRILHALSDYADQAESNADQKRLFAEDAAKGFAFIDLCRKRFDVVLMNPPFGKQSKRFESISKKMYTLTWKDLYSAFFERAKLLLIESGLYGAITSSQFLYTKQMVGLRRLWMKDGSLDFLVQLGHGVLDDAMVETGLTIGQNKSKNRQIKYIDLREDAEKNQKLLLQIALPKVVNIDLFKNLDNSPFSFDASPSLLKLWGDFKTLSSSIGSVATGNHTFDDFRFVRLFFEVNQEEISQRWLRFDKGGEYQPFVSPTTLVFDWKRDGRALRSVNTAKYGSDAQVMQASKYWYNPGICYSHVSSVAFGPRVLNAGTVFSSESISIFLENDSEDDRIALIAFLNSALAQELIWVFGKYRKIENRAVAGLPIDEKSMRLFKEKLLELGKEAIDCMIQLESTDETSPYFTAPEEFLEVGGKNISRDVIANQLKKITQEIDKISYALFEPTGLKREDAPFRADLVKKYTHRKTKNKADARFDSLSYFLGLVFGRWSGRKKEIKYSSPFDRLENLQPASIGMPEKSYLEVVSLDEGLNALISDLFIDTIKNDLQYFLNETCSLLGSDSLESIFKEPSKFFDYHLKKYSGSRRQAPIYWPLQTPSGSYTLWVYYHRLNEQTLYTCVNDFVEPKLQQVEQDLNGLRSKSARSSQEEKELEKLSDLASELRDFRNELLRLAKFWKPNLNDGVQITAAPLWKLFQHKAWQKKLKETWESLEKGDYDWAHLACSIWPERVLRKCHQDRSLAIAHDVEEHFWQEVEVPVKRGKKLTGETKLEWQPKALNEPALLALIKQIKEERGL